METTDKVMCRMVADLLAAHGVEMVVLSPGSRNAPLMVAVARHPRLRHCVIVDERCAGFYALGYAIRSERPVAVVCTSGTAVLNLSPAVAEAYYRAVPLIVISADRPLEWIDQDDSQTIRQAGALDRFVKQSYDLPADDSHSGNRWMANRLVNDALLTALDRRRGPVHINVRLDMPLHGMAEAEPGGERVITMESADATLSADRTRGLLDTLASPTKVMVIAGFLPPSARLNHAINLLPDNGNVAVLTETVANLHGPKLIARIDTTLSALDDAERRELAPDVVITLGGALVSRHIKQFLREVHPREHWQVGYSHTTVDCFRSLTRRFEIDPATFMRRLTSFRMPHKLPSTYTYLWLRAAERSIELHDRFIDSSPWSDMVAFRQIIAATPQGWDLQLSNGTPVRYSQLMDCSHLHRVDCNRGVSGIDGSTSTAIGAAAASGRPTLLITGDLSAQYDVGALLTGVIPANLRIIVIDNGGGGIFRHVATTASLPERADFFDAPACLPLEAIAGGVGMRYCRVTDADGLVRELPGLFDADGPAVMQVVTPPEVSGRVLNEYFKIR